MEATDIEVPPAQTDPAAGAPLGEPRALEADEKFLTDPSQIYGSFWIDQTELALPVSAIREVVNEPENVSQLPLAPEFLSGLFNLRGMIIPIVDLRILLEFPRPDAAQGQAPERKVAIIENGNKCVGLLFDRAGEVLNEPGSARVDFAAKEGSVKDIVIDGVLKLEDGKRMVQLIDPFEVLNIERVPQAEATAFAADQYSDLGSRLSCVSFQLGHTWCAIDLRYVQEVRDMPPVESSLLAHGYVIGTAVLRGDIIPVIDFRSYMGNENAYKLSAEALAKRKMLVMKTSGGLVGLMVYSIDSILPFFERDILPFAKLALPRGNVVKGCLVSETKQLVMLLDHHQLLADPGLSDPARLCQEVHQTEESAAEEAVAAKVGERRTFILFTASSNFAMDTCTVSEVVNRPEKLLTPPYALPFVEGIINLRGELITLVNLRQLYGLPGEAATEQKVLIFIHDGQKYAILVDSVDEIVMTTSENVSSDTGVGLSKTMSKASDDISGVLSVPRANSEKGLVMIMNVAALVSQFVVAADTAPDKTPDKTPDKAPDKSAPASKTTSA